MEETRSWPSVQLLEISTFHRCIASFGGTPTLVVPRGLDRRTRFDHCRVAYSFAERIVYNLSDRQDTRHDPQATRSYSPSYGTCACSCETRKFPPRRRNLPNIWNRTPRRRVKMEFQLEIPCSKNLLCNFHHVSG
jgi:hypothetical protein